MKDDYLMDAMRYTLTAKPNLTEKQRKDSTCRYLYDELEVGLECMKDFVNELAGNLEKDSVEYAVLSAAYGALRGALEGVEISYKIYKRGKEDGQQHEDGVHSDE